MDQGQSFSAKPMPIAPMTSFAALPSEILGKIRQHLNVTQMVHVGQTCENLRWLFISRAWLYIGYFPQNHTMESSHFKLKNYNKTLKHRFRQSSPKIPSNVLSGRAIEMDELTFLLMNNLVSDRTLSYVTRVTICAGYSIGHTTPNKKRKRTPLSPEKQFCSQRTARALFDTAILEIFAIGPFVHRETLESYTRLFADTGFLQAWSKALTQAILSIQQTGTFASSFLQGRRLRVGSYQTTNPTNFYYAKDLATNKFSFAKFVATNLFQFPNLRNLAIDAHYKFGVDIDNPHTTALYSTRAESLLSNIAMVLPRLPVVVAWLSIHGRLLHESFLSTNIEGLSKVKLVRFECYDTANHYLHGTRFMSILKARSRVEGLEIVTTITPKGYHRLNQALHPSTDFQQRLFLREIGRLASDGTAKHLALCSQYLTSVFSVFSAMNECYKTAQYNVDLHYPGERFHLREMFENESPALKVLRIISAKKYELDVPDITKLGLVNLRYLALRNITLGPEVTKLLERRPGLRIEQLNTYS